MFVWPLVVLYRQGVIVLLSSVIVAGGKLTSY